MKKPDLEKVAQEANEMQMLPATPVEILPLAALAIIFLVQLGIQQAGVVDDEFAKIGIVAARQLQKDLFHPDSEIYKALEFGWNPEVDLIDFETLLTDFEILRRLVRKFESDKM